MGELTGGFEPVEDVEIEVVAAGAALDDEWEDSDERGQGDEDVGQPGSGHGESIADGIFGVDGVKSGGRSRFLHTCDYAVRSK